MMKRMALFLISLSALAQNTPSLERSFEKASKSIVIVHSINYKGEEIALGSGVVVNGNIITNLHVIREASGVFISKGNKQWKVVKIKVHPKTDLASLDVLNFDLPAANLNSKNKLKIGQKVFAVGAPQGLELTLSDGIVSAMRSSDLISTIQTTAAISPGSSGGGLFNMNGELIGITTSTLKNSQNLNFAISSIHIRELETIGLNFANYKYNNAPKQIKYDKNKKYSSFDEIIEDAKNNNPFAQHKLAMAYEFGFFNKSEISKDFIKSQYWFNKAAQAGNIESAIMLGLSYKNGSNRYKNLVDARRYAFMALNILDTNYDIYTDLQFESSKIEYCLASAVDILIESYLDEFLNKPTDATQLKLMTWYEISSRLAGKTLVNIKSDVWGKKISGYAEQDCKNKIGMRDAFFADSIELGKSTLVADAISRAEAILNGFNVNL